MDWEKNKELVNKYRIKRSPLDFILPIFITTIACYVLTILICLIAGKFFKEDFIIFFVDTVQKIAGFGVVLSLLAFAPRIYKAKFLSDSTKLDKTMFYTKSELKSKLSDLDIIVFCGSLLAILISLLLTPVYHSVLESINGRLL